MVIFHIKTRRHIHEENRGIYFPVMQQRRQGRRTDGAFSGIRNNADIELR